LSSLLFQRTCLCSQLSLLLGNGNDSFSFKLEVLAVLNPLLLYQLFEQLADLCSDRIELLDSSIGLLSVLGGGVLCEFWLGIERALFQESPGIAIYVWSEIVIPMVVSLHYGYFYRKLIRLEQFLRFLHRVDGKVLVAITNENCDRSFAFSQMYVVQLLIASP